MSQTESSPDGVNILLVDDRPSNLTSLRALLAQPDYTLVLARSGQEALGQVLRREFALILLDVAMPGMDGFQTASIIKEREQSKLIPIIFITASVYDMEHIFRGYTVGAVDYLRKPIDPHAMRSKVGVFVELYRQRKEIERQGQRLREAELRVQRTLRERAEEALRESESMYQLAFEQAPVGIGHAGPGGRWTRANQRLADILGLDVRDLIGRRVEDMASGEERATLVERLAAVDRGGADYRGEHRLTKPHGGWIWVEITISALRSESGAIRSFIVVLHDISARKQAELERSRLVRELQEGIRARDDFLSLAAHELKTPLTPLRLQTQSLVRDIERQTIQAIPPTKLSRQLATVNRSAERLEGLIHRLLDASRLNVGAVSLELESVELVQLAKEAAGRLDYEAQRAGSTVAIEGPEPIVGHWDRLRLDQIITNLLSNAIKYAAGKPIEIILEADGDTATIRVRDHGDGIPLDAQRRIFERFERAAPVRNYGGFGLGLWIVRQLAEAHGGRASVKSEPGEGCEFIVELPRRAALLQSQRHPEAEEVHS